MHCIVCIVVTGKRTLKTKKDSLAMVQDCNASRPPRSAPPHHENRENAPRLLHSIVGSELQGLPSLVYLDLKPETKQTQLTGASGTRIGIRLFIHTAMNNYFHLSNFKHTTYTAPKICRATSCTCTQSFAPPQVQFFASA